MAASSYLGSLWDKVKSYAPTRQGVNSAGEAIAHVPSDIVGFLGDNAVRALPYIQALTGNPLPAIHAIHQQIQSGQLPNHVFAQPGAISKAANTAHDYIHQDTAAPVTPTQRVVDATIRGGPGGGAGQIAQEAIPDGKWYKPYAVDAATLTGMAAPGLLGMHGGMPDEITTGNDIVLSKGPAGPADGSAPVGAFSSQRAAAEHMRDNGMGMGDHDIVAHGDNSYSVMPRTATTPPDVITTPHDEGQAAQSAPQAPASAMPQEITTPAEGEAPAVAPQTAPQASAPSQATLPPEITTALLQPEAQAAPAPTPVVQEEAAPVQPRQTLVSPTSEVPGHAPPVAPIVASDGLPSNGMVPPVDPATLARVMGNHEDYAPPYQVAENSVPPAAIPGEITTTMSDASPSAPSSAPDYTNFVNPTVSPSGNYAHEVTADTPVNQAVYSEYKPSPTADPIQTGLLINKDTGKTVVNVDTKKMGNASDVANSHGPKAMHGLLSEVLQAHPEITEITGIRKTGAGGKNEITQGLSTAQVSRIRARTATPVNPISRLMADQRGSLGPGKMEPGVQWKAPKDEHNLFARKPENVAANPTPTLAHEDIRSPSFNADGKTVPAIRVFDKNTGETFSIARAKPFENKASRIQRAYQGVSRLMADERGSLGYHDDDPKSTDNDIAVSKLITVLEEGKPLRKVVRDAISKERSERINKANSAIHALDGEAAAHAALGALKGPMPKAVIPSIRKYFTPEEITHLFNIVKESNRVGGYDKASVYKALTKLFDDDQAELPTEGEQKLLGEVFPHDLIMALKDDPTSPEILARHMTNVLGIPRACKTIGDFGVAFRQCSTLIHTKAFWTSFVPMFKSIVSEKSYRNAQEAIKNMEYYSKMVEGRVAFTNMGSNLSEREEFAASQLAEHIPGVRQSERGFTIYLCIVRALTFDRLYREGLKMGLKDSPEYLKQLGDFVNTMSGRGSLGEKGDKAAPFLAAALFSPRLQVSRAKLLTYTVNPNFWRMPSHLKKEYFKGVASSALLWFTVLAIAKTVFGAKVSKNRDATDFGRAVIGKTHIDPSSSYQQWLRFAAQIVDDQKVNSDGTTVHFGSKFGAPTRLSTTTDFVEGKGSPNADTIMNEMRGKDLMHPKSAQGEVMDWKSTDPLKNPGIEMLLPMGLEAAMKADNAYGHQSLMVPTAGVLESIGIPANTYSNESKANNHKGYSGFKDGYKGKYKDFK